MKFARIIVSIGLWSVLFQWPCAGADPATPPAGHWQDTAMDPFLKMADGNNPGDPFPVYWDGVWHLYTMDSGSGSVQHFTSTDLVRWAVHPPAMTGADICTGSVVRHAGKYYLFSFALRIVPLNPFADAHIVRMRRLYWGYAFGRGFIPYTEIFSFRMDFIFSRIDIPTINGNEKLSHPFVESKLRRFTHGGISFKKPVKLPLFRFAAPGNLHAEGCVNRYASAY